MLNKHNLEIAKGCATSGRYKLEAVQVTSKYTVTTDGGQLIKVTTPAVNAETFPIVPGVAPITEDFKPFLLEASDALRIAKALPRKITIPILSNAAISSATDDTHAVVVTTDLQCGQTFTVRKIQGQFPDCERVIPDAEKADFAVDIDADKLRYICDRIIAFTGRQSPCRLHFYKANPGEPTLPVRLDAHNSDTGQLLTAILMPVKGVTDPVKAHGRC